MKIALIIPPSPFLLDERVVVNLGILKIGAMLKLHTADLDYTKISDYYNGVPGKYNSFVSTDTLSSSDLIKWRDSIETTVRAKFNLPYYTKAEASYDKSMGQ